MLLAEQARTIHESVCADNPEKTSTVDEDED
jgi:hypothetical protein